MQETTIQKDRLRWLVLYDEEELFLNIDRILDPPLPGAFLEIKSRTWSRVDAETKAMLLSNLLGELGLENAVVETLEYPDLITA